MSISRRDFMLVSASLAGTYCGLRNIFAEPSASTLAPPGEMSVKYYGSFSELPVGAVRPGGWIKSWLERQVEGLTGHPENLAYPYDTCMYAGKIPPPSVKHGEVWWPYEQTGYFVDGAVRLGFLTDNPAAQKIPADNINYILAHSGPHNLGESTWGWPNTVIGRALMAQYSATGNPVAVQVLTDYLLGSNIGPSRDGFVFEQALYVYGLTGDTRLLDIAKNVYERLFVNNDRSFSNISKIQDKAPLREHGVTAAEQLKLLPLLYSYTGDAQLLDLANHAYHKIEADSLMPDGGVVSSESLGTPEFNSLHETCDITDWSWGFGYMLLASGDAHWGDAIERAAFNALPGVVTKDFKQVQYFSSANQILASSTACPRIAMTRMSYRSAHDTPCCSGNVNRAMPNYVIRMWMRSPDGVAAALYGPSEVNTKINGQPLSIIEETDYPFRDTINFTVTLSDPLTFSLHLRIPQWCSAPTITVNGRAFPVEASPSGFAVIKREFCNHDVISLRLPMKVDFQNWYGGKAASIQRGPLVYSLKISETRVESMHEPDFIRRVLKGGNVKGFPAVEFFPQSEWRFGIDASLKNCLEQIQFKESPMPDNPFLADTAPVQLTVPVRQLDQWAADWKPVADPPSQDLKNAPRNPGLPTNEELQSAGAARPMTFVPYGSTHLRLTTLPLIGTTG